jgi:hypothetical protein
MQYDDEQAYDADIANAVRESEQEIFHEAVDGQEPDVAGDRQIVAEGSAVEGWDGRALSQEELAAVNLYGHPENGQDRPVEESEAAALRDQVTHLQQQNAALEQWRQNWIDEPVLEQNRQQIRETARNNMFERYGIFDDGSDKFDRFINDVTAAQQQTQALQDHRVNSSMQEARERYGADFDRTFESIASMRADNPMAQQIARSIVDAPDPGEAVMQWHDSQVVAGLNGGRSVPFLSQHAAPRGAARGRVKADDELSGSGFGQRDVEEDVFRSVWD